MDWHASVYGSRSGGGQYRDFSDGDADDDGVTYGARGSYADMADDTAGPRRCRPPSTTPNCAGSAATPCIFVRRTC